MIYLGVFEAWKKNISESLGKSRFLARSRQDALGELVDMLIEEKVSYDDALKLKNNLKNCLVTKKGLTGGGNHKGWKEAVENDYLRILYESYKHKNLLPLPHVGGASQNASKANFEANRVVSNLHPLMEIWGKQKYGEVWNEELAALVGTPDTSLHNLFLDEMFG
jgi:hypothetical protein